MQATYIFKTSKNLALVIAIISFSVLKSFAQDLELHKWEHRILIIKTSDENSENYQNQIKEFKKSTQELKDRKFVFYQIIRNDFVCINYENNEQNTSGKISKDLYETTLNNKVNFEVILIGLDGGVKLQQTELLKKEDLYKIVDAMPMRGYELRKKKN
jgi:hypothetical protein